VAIFIVLALTLRRKPDVLLNILPALKEDPRYQGLDKLPVILWVIAQASQGDPVVGMYAWVHNLLPLLSGKLGGNPQVRDLVLQLAERIFSGPKARPILLNGAVRKGERLVPPLALDQLMRLTFPSPSARVKATERFEAVYPSLKELALAGSPGAKAMKPVSQQLLPITVKAMRDDIPELSKEAADIFLWCLTQNPECFKQWEKLHTENVEASVIILRKLSAEWKQHATKFSPPDALRVTLKNLMALNEGALAEDLGAGRKATIKEADKYGKVMLGKVSRCSACKKSGLLVIALAVVAGAFAMSPHAESWDWKKPYVMFSSPRAL
ncbi:hypothetical protein Taro_039280, partial [Colocasia esculenta]|nr:hypothetical protein [Colocasia esculenta]